MAIDWEHQQTINKEQLKEATEKQEVKVVEVLSPRLYEEEGHIPSAINIPLTELKELAPKMLKKDENIVVYCSDIDCLASPVAGRTLREMGYKKVLDYEAGKKDWMEAGYPMRKGKNP